MPSTPALLSSSTIPVLSLTPLAYLACPALVLPTSPELRRPRPVYAEWWSAVTVVVRSSLTMTGCGGGGDGRGCGDDRRSRSR